MNKQQTEQLRSLVLQYFKCLSSGQNVIQSIKQTMFLQEQFNPLLLFDIIAQGKQLQTRKDWKCYLQTINVRFCQDEFFQFVKHYCLGEVIKFSQFLDMLMPYNQDVLRIFRKNYYQSIELHVLEHEIQLIFAQLAKFWIKFFGNLIHIKRQLGRIADRYSIQALIKHDLVLENKFRGNIRQSVKFKQKFEDSKYQIGFPELRVFLQLWLSPKNHNIELDLLQIKRHIGNQSPFQHICMGEKRISPMKKRVQSAQKIKKPKSTAFSTNIKHQKNNVEDSKNTLNRYTDFKSELLKDIQKMNQFDDLQGKDGYGAVSQRFESKPRQDPDNVFRKLTVDGPQLSGGVNMSKTKSKKSQSGYQISRSEKKDDYSRSLRYARQQSGINGSLAFFLFAEINTKEEVLQKMRKNLANRTDFNLINLHKLIDHYNKGYITATDLQSYCNTGKKGQFHHLIQHYAREKGKLRFQDFCMIFRPLSKKLNQVLDSRPQNNLPNPFKKQTISTISQILALSSLMFSNLYEIKQRINSSGQRPNSLFKYVDVKNNGFIQANDIRLLLEEKGVTCEQKNLKCIMKLFGKRVDDKIGVKEFQNFIDL